MNPMYHQTPAATDKVVQDGWKPIEYTLRNLWNHTICGSMDLFPIQDYMGGYTRIVDWHVYGPMKINPAGVGCAEVDKEKFQQLLHGLLDSLIAEEAEKVRIDSFIPSSSLQLMF